MTRLATPTLLIVPLVFLLVLASRVSYACNCEVLGTHTLGSDANSVEQARSCGQTDKAGGMSWLPMSSSHPNSKNENTRVSPCDPDRLLNFGEQDMSCSENSKGEKTNCKCWDWDCSAALRWCQGAAKKYRLSEDFPTPPRCFQGEYGGAWEGMPGIFLDISVRTHLPSDGGSYPYSHGGSSGSVDSLGNIYKDVGGHTSCQKVNYRDCSPPEEDKQEEDTDYYSDPASCYNDQDNSNCTCPDGMERYNSTSSTHVPPVERIMGGHYYCDNSDFDHENACPVLYGTQTPQESWDARNCICPDGYEAYGKSSLRDPNDRSHCTGESCLTIHSPRISCGKCPPDGCDPDSRNISFDYDTEGEDGTDISEDGTDNGTSGTGSCLSDSLNENCSCDADYGQKIKIRGKYDQSAGFQHYYTCMDESEMGFDVDGDGEIEEGNNGSGDGGSDGDGDGNSGNNSNPSCLIDKYNENCTCNGSEKVRDVHFDKFKGQETVSYDCGTGNGTGGNCSSNSNDKNCTCPSGYEKTKGEGYDRSGFYEVYNCEKSTSSGTGTSNGTQDTGDEKSEGENDKGLTSKVGGGLDCSKPPKCESENQADCANLFQNWDHKCKTEKFWDENTEVLRGISDFFDSPSSSGESSGLDDSEDDKDSFVDWLNDSSDTSEDAESGIFSEPSIKDAIQKLKDIGEGIKEDISELTDEQQIEFGGSEPVATIEWFDESYQLKFPPGLLDGLRMLFEFLTVLVPSLILMRGGK